MKDLIIKLLEKWTCSHKWEKYLELNQFHTEEDKLPHTIYHTLICQKCGKIEKIKL